MAAAGEAAGDARRERFLGHELAVGREGVRDRAVVAQHDPVGDVEAGLLAQVVQVVRELALSSAPRSRSFASNTTMSLGSGIRVFTPALDRAARPSATTRMAARMRRSSSSSRRAGSSWGKSLWCTDAGAPRTAARTRFW